MPALTARIRWLIGGGAVVAAVAMIVAAVVVLGARPAPEAMTYVPRDSDLVAELRPDFPGDQLSKVGNLLAHFPGFKDQSILGQKIDETLSKITHSATNGGVDYASQVKPWLAGPLYAGGRVSALSSGSRDDFVVVFTTDGSVTCDPVTNGSRQVEAYRGLDIHEPAAGDPNGAACAIDGRHAIVGSADWVKAALDAHANHTGVDGATDYRAARDRLGGDRLATIFVARSATGTSPAPSRLGTFLPTLDPAIASAFQALPAWLIAGIRAEDNALVADIVSAPFSASAAIPGLSLAPGASLLTAPPAHASQLASVLPADTAMLYEAHGGGVALQNLLTLVRSMPDLAGSLGQLDTALATLGGTGSLIGWVGDAGLAVVPDGTSLTGGLVLTAPDDATASAKAAQLTSLLRLAGLAGTVSLSVTETTIDGSHVTLADFGDISSLVGAATGGQIGGLPITPGSHLVISIAAHGSAVLIGSGESFARHVLETATGTTLADQASYRSAVALASATNAGQLFIAAAPLLEFADSAIPAADKARYESDIKPYLEPLDAFLETTTSDAGSLRVRIVLTVK